MSLNRNEVMRMRTEFCKENKIPQRYYRQRNTFIVDFKALEKYTLKFYQRTNQKDLANLKEKAFVSPKVLERLFYEELLQYINDNLTRRGNKVFKLLIYEGIKQKTIAKLLHITPRTVRRYVSKIKTVIRNYRK